MTESAKAAPRRRHAQGNRRRILDAARETLSADPETTVDDIARAAGIARRTLYGHFAGREDLVNALADDAVESLRQVFVEERNPADLALARYITAVWGIGDRFRVIIALGRRDWTATSAAR
ncbi:TetR/AcrR family transcriptional regulator [Streptomyces sp. NPDC006602]|uniref:TetR/AcrR family transcriptional regulator n=1 Tax=Streptomyces sp. NPDC006602 TaxID=3364751 RepID=UPI0036830ECF